MSKINSYVVVALPKLTDKLIGTSIDGVPTVIGSVPIFADNATAVAGGLAIGKLYRTGDILKIVHV